MQTIETSVDQTQAKAGVQRFEIADFRSGVTDKIDTVETVSNSLNEEIQSTRDEIAQVDSKMADLEALSIRLQ